MLAENISFSKVFGIGGVTVIMIIWLLPALIGLWNAFQSGNWEGVLTQSGGRLFAIDSTLREITDHLLDTDNPENTDISFKTLYLAYAISLFLVVFTVGVALFKFGSWAMGEKAFNPLTDILLFAGIILFFAILEFGYTYFLLNKIVIPFKDGMGYFISNLGGILKGMGVL